LLLSKLKKNKLRQWFKS